MEEIELSDKQSEAVRICTDLRNRIAVVNGPAGTGKTTITRKGYNILTNEGLKCVLCAPTGKAAKRIQEATGIAAITIHRLLEYPYPGERDPKTGKPLVQTIPKRDRLRPIDYDVVFCDEYAMVTWEVHNNLLAALPRGGCIRCFGDLAQLPPIEQNKLLAAKPSPFAQLIEKFKHVELDHIFRQQENSGILHNANLVLRKRIPQRRDDFTIDITSQPLSALEDYVFDAQSKGILFNSIENQIISPSRKSWVGTYQLNQLLQRIFMPDAPTTGIKLPRHQWEQNQPVWIDIGDKVVWNQNTYDLRSYPDRFADEDMNDYIPADPTQMILNGETGIVTEIVRDGEDAGSFILDVGDREVYIPHEILELTRRSILVSVDLRTRCALAYAMTTHKSQGSEYNHVVYVLNKSTGYMQDRHNLYTAITRARKHVHVITDMPSIQRSVIRKEVVRGV